MPDIRVAWWNLENLFDHEKAKRPAELAKEVAGELKGWSKTVRDKKIRQLARVIRGMFNQAGPDLLGVCEVENESVVKRLAKELKISGRKYKVVSHDSPDARGIDVSFIVDTKILEPEESGHQVVIKRSATRDIFWVDLVVRETGSVFVAVANHWPSRTAGQYSSEPSRMLTGETLSYVLSQLQEAFVSGDEIPIIVMGDFNDEPFNRAMQEYLLGARDRQRVTRAKTPRALNLMWPLMVGRIPGTYKYSSDWNMLDQFLVTKGMLNKKSPVRVLTDSTAIYTPQIMQKKNGAPHRFGRPSKSGYDKSGFSDHFPITVLLRAE